MEGPLGRGLHPGVLGDDHPIAPGGDLRDAMPHMQWSIILDGPQLHEPWGGSWTLGVPYVWKGDLSGCPQAGSAWAAGEG
jgi:hypothetical protein